MTKFLVKTLLEDHMANFGRKKCQFSFKIAKNENKPVGNPVG